MDCGWGRGWGLGFAILRVGERRVLRVRGLRVSVIAAMLSACTAAPPAVENDMGAGAPPELASALNVSVGGDSVRLELHVTNATEGALRLEFATSQRYDFAISDEEGAEVWRWSDDMMFAQALGAEALLAGESRRYGASWSGAGRAGEFTATGRLTSTNYPVELRTRFRLPVE
jgi:hypothetical protein